MYIIFTQQKTPQTLCKLWIVLAWCKFVVKLHQTCWLHQVASGLWESDIVSLKALSHGAIFLATCNAILLLVDACKIGKYTFPSQFANIFLTYHDQTFVTNLHLLRVELRCKLPGKLHRVTGPLQNDTISNSHVKQCDHMISHVLLEQRHVEFLYYFICLQTLCMFLELLTTCHKIVIINPGQAMRTHPDINFMTAK